jgi:hypothetical protein
MEGIVEDWEKELPLVRDMVKTSASNVKKITELEGRIARMEKMMAKASKSSSSFGNNAN